jgi:hypothetical protein
MGVELVEATERELEEEAEMEEFVDEEAPKVTKIKR